MAANAERLVTDPSSRNTADARGLWVPEARPFLDRTDLRRVLSQYAQGVGLPVIRTLKPTPEPGLLNAAVAVVGIAFHRWPVWTAWVVGAKP